MLYFLCLSTLVIYVYPRVECWCMVYVMFDFQFCFISCAFLFTCFCLFTVCIFVFVLYFCCMSYVLQCWFSSFITYIRVLYVVFYLLFCVYLLCISKTRCSEDPWIYIVVIYCSCRLFDLLCLSMRTFHVLCSMLIYGLCWLWFLIVVCLVMRFHAIVSAHALYT